MSILISRVIEQWSLQRSLDVDDGADMTNLIILPPEQLLRGMVAQQEKNRALKRKQESEAEENIEDMKTVKTNEGNITVKTSETYTQ